MTRLDWIILGFAAFTALMGYRRGLVRAALSLAGLAAGAVIGARIAPHVLSAGTDSRYTALIGLAGAFIGASVLQTVGSWLGGMFRSTLHLTPPLRLLDSLGGLAAGAVWGSCSRGSSAPSRSRSPATRRGTATRAARRCSTASTSSFRRARCCSCAPV